MSSIESKGQARLAQNHPSENSRRPGTAGHPGKHLGQFKKAGMEPDQGSQSLVAQQLSALQGGTRGGADQQFDSAFSIASNHMNDMSNAFTDQISFTSKMHAISTGLL